MSEPGRSWSWVLGWAALVLAALAFRDPVPVDETRYLSVAWEMWLRGDLLVPHLNGEPYSHKPPLLFWLIQAGWAAFGVNEWWPRLVPPLFALLTVLLTYELARRLWPAEPLRHELTPWMLAGSFFWALYTPMTMFDMLLAAFTVAAMLGLVRVDGAARARTAAGGWLLFGTALGLGLLAKGPVMFVHALFPAVLGPLWSPAARHRAAAWYGGLAGGLLIGAALVLAWLLPALARGGPAYEEAVLWHQTADRVVDSFAHGQPWWWYLPWLPLLLFPWLLWPPAWRGLGRLRERPDAGVRLCLAWVLPALAILTLVSAKQPHYLLPLFPGFALILAAAVQRAPTPRTRADQWPPAAGLILLGAALLAPGFGWGPHVPDWTAGIAPFWGLAVAALGVALGVVHSAPTERLARSLAAATMGAVLLLDMALYGATGAIFDLRPVAERIRLLQEQGLAVAHVNTYHGQFNFLGRLRRPLDPVSTGRELERWLRAHPDGWVLYYTERDGAPDRGAPFVTRYRGRWLYLRPAAQHAAILAQTRG